MDLLRELQINTFEIDHNVLFIFTYNNIIYPHRHVIHLLIYSLSFTCLITKRQLVLVSLHDDYIPFYLGIRFIVSWRVCQLSSRVDRGLSQAMLPTMLILTAYHNQRLQPIHTMDWNSKCGTVQSRSLSQQQGRERTFPRYYTGE